MENIPFEVLQWFQENELLQYDVVEYNPRKGRWCFSVVCKDNKKLFFKWNDDEDAHLEFKQQLERECIVYKTLDGLNITPKYFGGVIPAFQNIEAITLRQKIIELSDRNEDDKIVKIVVDVIKKWVVFIDKSRSTILDLKMSDPIWEFSERYLWALLLSSPLDNHLGKFERCRNEVIHSVISKLYKKIIKKEIERAGSKPVIIHGDFHANNVLVDNKDNTYIIDFEDIRKGLPEQELAFMISMISGLVTKNRLKEIEERVMGLLPNYINISLFRKVLCIYKFAVNFNHTLVISNTNKMLKNVVLMGGVKLMLEIFS